MTFALSTADGKVASPTGDVHSDDKVASPTGDANNDDKMASPTGDVNNDDNMASPTVDVHSDDKMADSTGDTKSNKIESGPSTFMPAKERCWENFMLCLVECDSVFYTEPFMCKARCFGTYVVC